VIIIPNNPNEIEITQTHVVITLPNTTLARDIQQFVPLTTLTGMDIMRYDPQWDGDVSIGISREVWNESVIERGFQAQTE